MLQTRKILQGSVFNIARVVLSMVVALVLPPLLVHRMEPAEYGAWVLILQCSAYVNLLDFGLQTAVAKYVAEYDALDDRATSSRILSTSVAILCISALFGALVVVLIAWRVPQLFHQMPSSLIGDVRMGILAIGLSTVVALPFGPFLAVFTGLQRYGFPTVLSMLSKLFSSAALAVLLLMHGKLVQLVWVRTTFNLATALGQFLGWTAGRQPSCRLWPRLVSWTTAVRLVKYSCVLLHLGDCTPTH